MSFYHRVQNKLLHYFRKPIVPPTYQVKRAVIGSLKDKYRLRILVETGTFLGDTVEFFKTNFEKVISIELADELARKVQERFKDDENVTLYHGDSGEILKTIINDFKQPVLFWLDGHYSSEFFIGDEFIKTAKTDVETPIEEELRTILKSPYNHVILIDDARLFTGLNDYPTISKIKRMVKNSGKSYTVEVENDMVKILPKNVL